MRILGINALNHDASVCVLEDADIKFAAHAERYSRKKNDHLLNDDLMDEAFSHGEPDKIVYFERPWLKKTRQLYAGQYSEVFNTSNTPNNSKGHQTSQPGPFLRLPSQSFGSPASAARTSSTRRDATAVARPQRWANRRSRRGGATTSLWAPRGNFSRAATSQRRAVAR